MSNQIIESKIWITIVLGVSVALILLTSCMKEEPLNAEADIEMVTLHVANPELMFFQMTDSTQTILSTDTTIVFSVRSDADVSALAPELIITAGATVTPASGTMQDFSKGPITYTVTSQDHKWQRRYQLSVVPTLVSVDDTVAYDFEHYELEPNNQRYYIWHNLLDDGTLGNDWATANAGFRISMSSATADEYPTVPMTNGYDGAAVCLTTRDTGPFGRMANKRLAAGNLYLGTFDVSVATRNPLQATRFGIPFTSEPISFSGYYTFEPGEHYQDFDGNYIDEKTDTAAIYAVMYRNHDADGNEIVLHGDDVLSNSNIVALAWVNVVPNQQWTAWNVKFNYYTPLDLELLANKGYSLAVVFSSSKRGGAFEGAIGSKLCIDKVKIICTREE